MQLNCFVAKGDLPLRITWTFLGEPISLQMGMSAARMGDRTSFITIESLKASHTGNYTCTAKNAAGSTSYTAHLFVSGWHSFI